MPETLKLGLAPEADAAGGTGSMQLFNKREMERKKLLLVNQVKVKPESQLESCRIETVRGAQTISDREE